MVYVLLLALGAGVLLYFVLRRTGVQKVPQDVYVCDICGETDCICHKEEQP
ncbi:MAG: hypothetical protein AB1512_18165 [Thermodesulfobacteriota bacterium]